MLQNTSTDWGYIHTKQDKFYKATFFYPDRPSVHTKTFLVTKNRTFWKCFPKHQLGVLVWKAKRTFLKMLTWQRNDVDGEHFICFHDKNTVFKFIWLSVDLAWN